MDGAFSDCAIDIRVEDVIVGDRVRKNLGDMVPLQVSMTRVGQLQPIGITHGNELVFGLRRLEAARAMGWETIRAVRLDSLTDAGKLALAEQDENTCRESFTPLEMLEMSKRIDAVLPRNKGGRPAEKTVPTGGIVSEPDRKTAQNSAKPPKTTKEPSEKKGTKPKKRREQIAEAVGTSHENLRRIETVAQAAEADPEKFGPVAAEMESTGNVAAAYQAVKETAPERDDGESLRAKILDRIGPALEKAIRELCATEAGANIDRAKALDLLSKLVAAVRGQKKRLRANPDLPDKVDPKQAEALLQAYPRKVAPANDLKAIGKALTIASFETLMDAVQEFAKSPAGDRGAYTPHAATWFNQRRWLADRAEWYREETSGQKPRDKMAGLREYASQEPRRISTKNSGLKLLGGGDDSGT